ncbi:MAG: hypothetical protein MUE50_07045 [Pirellulaceae bacterium]|nr:hypothetical protein [Pirellulaceae bacterium]
MTPRELETLVHRHLDGLATAEELAALSGELERDEGSRVLYLQLAELHAALAVRDDLAGESVPPCDVPPKLLAAERTPSGLRSVPASRWLWRSVLGAAVVALVLLGWWGLQQDARLAPPAVPELGTLTGTLGLQPAAPEAAMLRPGQKLTAGRLSLSAGVGEITLQNGVQILFEGPGELELLTPMRAVLHSGQAVVRVPEAARGFQLDTASIQVVDLGTEFGVKCGAGGTTDVLVFAGEIIASPRSGSSVGFPQQLAEGKAARFSPAQSQSACIEFRPERFVRRLPADKPVELEEHRSPMFNATRFEEIVVSRVQQPIVVDGDLSDWSDAGSFRAERSGADAQGQFVEGRMRYDAGFLYIAAHIGDPAPLRNVMDPATDGELGWRGGGLQVRLSTDRELGWPVDANAPVYYQFRRIQPDTAHLANATSERLAHLTFWHHAPSARNCLHVAYGMDFHGGAVNPPGYRGVFRKGDDGRGYTLEYAVPWSLLGAAETPPRPGDTLAVSWTTHWSDAGGRLWRGQLVELRNSSEPVRIHTWERAATWGRALYR